MHVPAAKAAVPQTRLLARAPDVVGQDGAGKPGILREDLAPSHPQITAGDLRSGLVEAVVADQAIRALVRELQETLRTCREEAQPFQAIVSTQQHHEELRGHQGRSHLALQIPDVHTASLAELPFIVRTPAPEHQANVMQFFRVHGSPCF